MKKSIFLILLVASLVAVGCNTTRKLGADEVLYTGVKKMRIIPEEKGIELTSDAESSVRDLLSVKPNGAIYGPYVRWPFPFGLWVYNNVEPKKDKGFVYRFYERYARKPVLISTVQPDLRVTLVPEVLANYGYFSSTATYSLHYNRNHKKARISYEVVYGEPWRYSTIEYPAPVSLLAARIDSLQATSLLHPGDIYEASTLSAERSRIAAALRNEGYYYFRPDYLSYLVDTTKQQKVAVRMQLYPDLPAEVERLYRVGEITFNLKSASGKGEVDTTQLSNQRLIFQAPLKIKKRFLERNISLASGDLLTTDKQNESLKNLARMGVFRYVNFSVSPSDSLLWGNDYLDVLFDAEMDIPMEAWFEANVVSSSNSFIGPGVIFGLAHKNVFGGGERLSLELSGSYEWQTGKRKSAARRSSMLNSYEFGLKASLVFPRLLPSSLLWDSRIERHYGGSTTIQLGADLMNRPKYFRMLSFNASLAFDFQSSDESSHTFQLPKIGYNYLLNSTASFDSTMQENPAIALSFSNQLIPVVGYTYRYDKLFGHNESNHIFWQNSFSTAGNLLSSVVKGQNGQKTFLGIPFSQFAKATTDFRYYRRLWGDVWVATRFLAGVGWAYGNSSVMPYSEQFYIGGANSIRAFVIRTIGPGSYAPPQNTTDAYLDQTGNFKLESNIELRFPILGGLHGALFLDAGNIWLLKTEANRPGGTLNAKTFWRDIALGTGFGFRYDISFLILRLDVGIALHAPYNNDKPRYYNIDRKDSFTVHVAIGYPF